MASETLSREKFLQRVGTPAILYRAEEPDLKVGAKYDKFSRYNDFNIRETPQGYEVSGISRDEFFSLYEALNGRPVSVNFENYKTSLRFHPKHIQDKFIQDHFRSLDRKFVEEKGFFHLYDTNSPDSLYQIVKVEYRFCPDILLHSGILFKSVPVVDEDTSMDGGRGPYFIHSQLRLECPSDVAGYKISYGDDIFEPEKFLQWLEFMKGVIPVNVFEKMKKERNPYKQYPTEENSFCLQFVSAHSTKGQYSHYQSNLTYPIDLNYNSILHFKFYVRRY
jgi:hypothetical protein